MTARAGAAVAAALITSNPHRKSPRPAERGSPAFAPGAAFALREGQIIGRRFFNSSSRTTRPPRRMSSVSLLGLDLLDVLGPSGDELEEVVHFPHPGMRVLVRRARYLVEQQVPQHGQGRVELPPPTLLGERTNDLPDVLGCREVLAPVSRQVLQGARAARTAAPSAPWIRWNARTRGASAISSAWQRPRREEQQGADLPDRPVDAPSAAHFAEMQHECLNYG